MDYSVNWYKIPVSKFGRRNSFEKVGRNKGKEVLTNHYQAFLDTVFLVLTWRRIGFPGGSDCKESAFNVRDPGLIPELEWSPKEGNGCPLQYSCLENPMDRGTWQATVHGVSKRQDWATEHTHIYPSIYLSIISLPCCYWIFICIKLYNLCFHDQMFTFSTVCFRYNHTFTSESIFSFPSYVRIHCMNMSRLCIQSWWVSQTLMS